MHEKFQTIVTMIQSLFCVYSAQDSNKLGTKLLKSTREIASAMVYLSTKGFIHRDLAARNVLVSMDGVCKVSHVHNYRKCTNYNIALCLCTRHDYYRSPILDCRGIYKMKITT